MHPEPVFRVFGFAHLVVLFLIVAIPVGLGIAVRLTNSQRIDRAVAICVALLLATNYLGYAVYIWQHQLLFWKQALPFQLCDWAMVTIIVALLTKRHSWTEVSYFWGIGGTFQALLTPNLQVDFPDIRAISFFVGHGGIVAGVIYLLVARRFRPTLGSVGRTLAWSQLYLVSTLLVDYLTGVNYGFLLHKPVVASILDYLSDTRWIYILELEGLALLFFAILYLPFAFRSARRPNRGALLVGVIVLTTFANVRAAPPPAEKPVEALIPWLLKEDEQLREIPFAKVIEDTTGRKVLAIDPKNPTDERVLKQIGGVLDEVVRQLNEPGSAIQDVSRINEASSHFEDLMRKLLDAAPGLRCDFPRTADGHAQRSGYPDLRVLDEESKRVYYLDPKLYAAGSRESSFRTFYFEPKKATNKVLDDAVHLVAGFEHAPREDGRWKFTRWDLVDLARFRVRLKAEFQGSNRDLYRPEAIVGSSAK